MLLRAWARDGHLLQKETGVEFYTGDRYSDRRKIGDFADSFIEMLKPQLPQKTAGLLLVGDDIDLS